MRTFIVVEVYHPRNLFPYILLILDPGHSVYSFALQYSVHPFCNRIVGGLVAFGQNVDIGIARILGTAVGVMNGAAEIAAPTLDYRLFQDLYRVARLKPRCKPQPKTACEYRSVMRCR